MKQDGMKQDTRSPGSKEAIDAGCLCPRMDNEYGKGYHGNGEKFGFVVNYDCPLHGLDDE